MPPGREGLAGVCCPDAVPHKVFQLLLWGARFDAPGVAQRPHTGPHSALEPGGAVALLLLLLCAPELWAARCGACYRGAGRLHGDLEACCGGAGRRHSGLQVCRRAGLAGQGSCASCFPGCCGDCDRHCAIYVGHLGPEPDQSAGLQRQREGSAAVAWGISQGFYKRSGCRAECVWAVRRRSRLSIGREAAILAPKMPTSCVHTGGR